MVWLPCKGEMSQWHVSCGKLEWTVWLGFLTMVSLYGKCQQWGPVPQWKLFHADLWPTRNWRGPEVLQFWTVPFLTLLMGYLLTSTEIQSWSYLESHAIYSQAARDMGSWTALHSSPAPLLELGSWTWSSVCSSQFPKKNTLRNLRARCQESLILLVFLEWLYATLTEYFKQESELAVSVGKDIFRVCWVTKT